MGKKRWCGEYFTWRAHWGGYFPQEDDSDVDERYMTEEEVRMLMSEVWNDLANEQLDRGRPGAGGGEWGHSEQLQAFGADKPPDKVARWWLRR